MAGGMDVHKNKFVEQWATNRENLELAFRFNRKTIPICIAFGIIVPLLTYQGIVAEFKFLLAFGVQVRTKTILVKDLEKLKSEFASEQIKRMGDPGE